MPKEILDALVFELSTTHFEPVGKGKTKAESKAVRKKRMQETGSPDVRDGAVICVWAKCFDDIYGHEQEFSGVA